MVDRLAYAAEIMQLFASATGLVGSEAPRRYLWTDAFAVCNLLGLWRTTGSSEYRQMAVELVDQVHRVLGRHRPDDSRDGWISGLSEAEGERHPTRGGLRIGKPRRERRPGEPANPQAEWEQDGQYYHYLTKWMHALYRMAVEIGESTYHRWAVELAEAAHDAFVQSDSRGAPTGMVWKMSIALDRVLVGSMGQHDPLDGLVVLRTLQDVSSRGEEAGDLSSEIEQLEALCRRMSWATQDPLGAGGLLMDAHGLAQLVADGAEGLGDVLERVLDSAVVSVEASRQFETFSFPAARRLAFRELGLAIGLAAVERIEETLQAIGGSGGLLSRVQDLRRHVPLKEEIEAFWSDPAHQSVTTWREHEDINRVMLATSLLPGGYYG